MVKLIVVGNGFDLYHKLPTKYADFGRYLLSDETTRNSTSGPSNIKFYNDLTKYISGPIDDSISDNENNYITLWNNFEKALGSFDNDQLIEDNDCYLTNYSADDWRDNDNFVYQQEIECGVNFKNYIPYFLSKWINSIKIPTIPKVPKISPKLINPDNLFLSFNYTDTLEKIYNIPTNRILYIHGKASRGDKLIAGHHDKTLFKEDTGQKYNSGSVMPQYSDDDCDDIRSREGMSLINDYFRDTFKDTSTIIKDNRPFFDSLNNMSDVYVFGHSLSKIDFEYFQEIKKSVSEECTWYISYHNSIKSINKACRLVHYLGLNKYDFFRVDDEKIHDNCQQTLFRTWV